MAKYLDLTGLKYFITKRIGKTDISKIGDGTCTGAISALNQSLGKKQDKEWVNYSTITTGQSYTIPDKLNEILVHLTIYYGSNIRFLARDYVIKLLPTSDGNNYIYADGFYYDSSNYASWAVVYNPAGRLITFDSSWTKSVVNGSAQSINGKIGIYGK